MVRLFVIYGPAEQLCDLQCRRKIIPLRGISEVGVYAALLDAGIPIDAVGGTSIGSIVAGGAARDMTPAAVAQLLREAVVDGKSPVDVTFPIVSIASGARVTEQMRKVTPELEKSFKLAPPRLAPTTNPPPPPLPR